MSLILHKCVIVIGGKNQFFIFSVNSDISLLSTVLDILSLFFFRKRCVDIETLRNMIKKAESIVLMIFTHIKIHELASTWKASIKVMIFQHVQLLLDNWSDIEHNSSSIRPNHHQNWETLFIFEISFFQENHISIRTRKTKWRTILMSSKLPLWYCIWFFQGSFISEMERTPFDSLFWHTNGCIAKLTISITSGVSLWVRPCY